MKNENHKPEPLRNVSLYFQLGLVASLFLAYFVLELETEKKTFEEPYKRVPPIELSQVDFDHRITIEKKPVQNQAAKPEPIIVPKPIDQLQIIDDSELEDLVDIKNIVFINPSPDDESLNIPNPSPKPKIHEMATLDAKPTFMACAHLKGEAREKCFKEQLAVFFRKNLNYPEAAQNSGTQGTVLVEFIVSNQGTITSVKPLRKALSPDLEKEALKAVSKLPKMSPGISNGKAVDVRYVLPVSFKLNN
jgi:periplasmic protein TonB